MNKLLFYIGNLCFKLYIRRAGKESPKRVLTATLAWLRVYANDNKLDFSEAVNPSQWP